MVHHVLIFDSFHQKNNVLRMFLLTVSSFTCSLYMILPIIFLFPVRKTMVLQYGSCWTMPSSLTYKSANSVLWFATLSLNSSPFIGFQNFLYFQKNHIYIYIYICNDNNNLIHHILYKIYMYVCHCMSSLQESYWARARAELSQCKVFHVAASICPINKWE